MESMPSLNWTICHMLTILTHLSVLWAECYPFYNTIGLQRQSSLCFHFGIDNHGSHNCVDFLILFLYYQFVLVSYLLKYLISRGLTTLKILIGKC